MEQVNLEPVVIEDLVKFGEDRGRLEGKLEGKLEGRLEEQRSTLRRVLALRKLVLSPEDERQLDACTDLEKLRRWVDQAVLASGPDEVLR